MAHHDHIKRDKWFAWRPVKTTDVGWVWMKMVNREVDARPLVYMGMHEEFRYWVNTAPECFHCLDMTGKCFICEQQIQ